MDKPSSFYIFDSPTTYRIDQRLRDLESLLIGVLLTVSFYLGFAIVGPIITGAF